MKNRFLSLTLLGCSLGILTSTSHAAWQLVDDFESYDTGSTGVYDAEGLFPYHSIAHPLFRVYADTVEDGNQGYFVDWGTRDSDSGAEVWVTVPIPEIPLGSTGTIYLRYQKEGDSNTWHMGATDLEAGRSGNDTGGAVTAWGDNCTILRVNTSTILEAHTGGTYRESVPNLIPSTYTWYQVWMVLNNADEGDQVWQVYVQGPNDTEPQLLQFNPDAPTSTLGFRRQAEDSLKFLVLSSNTNKSPDVNTRDVWMVDDIYVDVGNANIGDPRVGEDDIIDPFGEAQTWRGFTAQSDGWVDTGAALGWVWVNEAPWIWIDSLDKFIYLPDDQPFSPDSTGSWFWVPQEQ